MVQVSPGTPATGPDPYLGNLPWVCKWRSAQRKICSSVKGGRLPPVRHVAACGSATGETIHDVAGPALPASGRLRCHSRSHPELPRQARIWRWAISRCARDRHQPRPESSSESTAACSSDCTSCGARGGTAPAKTLRASRDGHWQGTFHGPPRLPGSVDDFSGAALRAIVPCSWWA